VIPSILSESMNSPLPAGTAANQTESSPTVSKRNPVLQEQKLRRAAAEFESILISSFWKSMMETFSSGDDSLDPGHSGFQDMGIQAMSQAVGKAGGLGLGQLIIKHLEPHLQESTPSERPQKP
jgi:Rod binding domain-containing protein